MQSMPSVVISPYDRETLELILSLQLYVLLHDVEAWAVAETVEWAMGNGQWATHGDMSCNWTDFLTWLTAPSTISPSDSSSVFYTTLLI